MRNYQQSNLKWWEELAIEPEMIKDELLNLKWLTIELEIVRKKLAIEPEMIKTGNWITSHKGKPTIESKMIKNP